VKDSSQRRRFGDKFRVLAVTAKADSVLVQDL
jgi:hypothetical protein